MADRWDGRMFASEEPAQRDTASFPSFFTFSFMDDLIYTGFKRKLRLNDLHRIRDEDKSHYRSQQLWRHLMTTDARGEEKFTGIGRALIRSFWRPLVSSGVWKLALDGLTFVSPLLLKRLLKSIRSGGQMWQGFAIVVLMLMANVATDVTQGQFFYRIFVLGVQVRTSLMAVIYKKALRIKSSVRTDNTAGEMVNLMSIDASRLEQLTSQIHLSWTGGIKIAVAFYLLYGELGNSAFCGLVVMALLVPVIGLLSRVDQRVTRKQMELKDERVKRMTEILGGIKVLKLYAWERAFSNLVNRVRMSELSYVRIAQYLDVVFNFIFCSVPVLISVSSFTAYALSASGHQLDAPKVFFSLSLFNILRVPLLNWPQIISHIISSHVSLKRLNNFMETADISDYRTRNHDDTHAVAIESASFDWSFDVVSDTRSHGDDVPLGVNKCDLRIRDFNVPMNSFVAIVGTVGSGKSSLLSAILSEMTLRSGRVNISANIRDTAYVSQEPWIQNMSLRDNVLFGQEYDEQRYAEVMTACALLQDLAILPSGDETEIVEKGTNLSGGQKQRLSLARACYSDADLFLLDDPLSAVDAHVAKSLFDNVLSSRGGILRNKTRVLVTNSVTLLPHVDQIFVMEDGRISESGSYEQLLQNAGHFSHFLEEYDVTKQKTQPQEKTIKTTETASGKKAICESESGSREDLAVKSSSLSEEATADGSVKLSVFLHYFSKVRFVPLAVLFLIASHACDAGSKYWLSLWSSDPMANATHQSDGRLLDERLLVYALLGLGNTILMLFGGVMLARGATTAAFSLHQNLLDAVLRSPISFFQRTPSGRVVNRFSGDIESVDMQLMHLWFEMFQKFIDIIHSFVMIIIAIPVFAAVVLPLLLIFLLMQRFYMFSLRQFRRLEATTMSPIFSCITETSAGLSTIRAHGESDRFLIEAEKTIDRNVVCALCNITADRWLAMRLQLMGNMNVSTPLSWLLPLMASVESEMVSLERILEYTANESEAEWESSSGKGPPSDWPSAGAIDFQDLSVRYRPELPLVLQNMTVHISSGQKIGIVGRTGAGKSTITLSLFRMLEAVTGSVFIDGVDIRSIGLHDVRRRLTIIPQETFLFSGSLRVNLDPMAEKTDQEIWQSLELSHLKDWVSGQENGLQFLVSEGGENLSSGQRQLLCLTRALLRKTQILLLDEATAALDLQTDSLIQSTIRSAFSKSTVLTIAHRLHTILDSDKVMVLDTGRVVEFDSPTALLQDRGSLFHSLALDAGIICAPV